jgi:hypothetical protein
MKRVFALSIIGFVLGSISFSLLFVIHVFRQQSNILTFPHFYLGLLALIILAVSERPDISVEQPLLLRHWFFCAISLGIVSLLLVFTAFCCITYLNDFLVGEFLLPIGWIIGLLAVMYIPYKYKKYHIITNKGVTPTTAFGGMYLTFSFLVPTLMDPQELIIVLVWGIFVAMVSVALIIMNKGSFLSLLFGLTLTGALTAILWLGITSG